MCNVRSHGSVMPTELEKDTEVHAINETPISYSFVRRAILCRYLPSRLHRSGRYQPVLPANALVLSQYFILTGPFLCPLEGVFLLSTLEVVCSTTCYYGNFAYPRPLFHIIAIITVGFTSSVCKFSCNTMSGVLFHLRR